MNDTVALIQARMSSSRLPGKVLSPIGGIPMILRVVARVQQARMVPRVAVITSRHRDDDPLENVCRENGLPCFRGSLEDVLDRYYQAALHFGAGTLVRITADCPLLDPGVVDLVVSAFQKGSFDYVSNTMTCTYPDGLDTEVFSLETLARAWREATLKSEREHVTAYIYKHPELFRLKNVSGGEDLSSLRWTVDTAGDLEFVRAVYGHFGDAPFAMAEIIRFIRERPEIGGLNAGQERNEGYLKSLHEDRENK